MQIHYAFETDVNKAKEQIEIWSKEGCGAVCIFGTGKFGTNEAYTYITKILQFNVVYFCDNDPEKWGLLYTKDNIKCISPQELNQKRNQIICFVCLLQDEALTEVTHQLMAIQVEHIIPLTDSISKNSKEEIFECNLKETDKKIIVRFQGGLGNQMFQYAFYKALKIKYPFTKIKADINLYYKIKFHYGFELTKIFNIELDIASKWECIQAKIEYENIKENNSLIFDNNYFNLINKDYYLIGNWCNENYFFDIKETLFLDFKIPQSIYEHPLIDDIINNESVSIHLRKGDYINTYFDVLTLDYYKLAIDYIFSKVKNPVFYIFSDDIEYANEFFAFLQNKYIISNNQSNNSYKDMLLMSKCKHNINANSTFSFWGAYLNNNKYKIVIVPNVFKNCYNEYLSCKNWIVINIASKNLHHF